MNKYELAAILNPDLSEKDVAKLVQELKDLLTAAGATELMPERIERRALAYLTKKFREGYYVFLDFTGPASLPAAMQTELKHRQEVLRLAFLRLPEVEPVPEEPASAVEPPAEVGPAPEVSGG
ncbi:MAG: 30S ribosomal protein S6 [candidate division WOR-3 bacterium]